MVNEKPKIDNRAKEKSKQKKDPLEVKLSDLATVVDGVEFNGKLISGEADALASAKRIYKMSDAVIEAANPIVKGALLRQWCKHVHEKGKPPEMRMARSNISTFKVVQQTPVKVTEEKVKAAARLNMNLAEHSSEKKYSISLGNASSQQQKDILAHMKEVLGDDYKKVVSEALVVGEEFFDNYQENVRKTLAEDEDLLEKMVALLAIISPTILLSEFATDLPDKSAFEFTAESFRIDAQKKEAQNVAKQEAKAAEKERKRIEKEKAKEEKRKAREVEKARKKAEKEKEKAAKNAEKAAEKERKKIEKAAAKTA